MGAIAEIFISGLSFIAFLFTQGEAFKRRFSNSKLARYALLSIFFISSLFLVDDIYGVFVKRAPIPATISLDSAQAYYLRGREFLLVKKVPEAISDFNSAIMLQPDFPEALQARAQAKSSSGDWDGAIADLDAAIRLEPGLEGAKEQRSIVLDQKSDDLLEPLWDDMESRW